MSLWRRIYEERKRVILPLGVFLVANIATGLLAVLPLQRSVTNAQSESADAKLALANARLLEKRAKDQRASKERADLELTKFYSDILPKDEPTATGTTNAWLLSAASSNGVQFKGSHYDFTDVRDSRLVRAYSKITLTGTYTNIRKFLYALETAEEFIVVERVELAQPDDTPATSGKLEVALTVATYFLSPAAR